MKKIFLLVFLLFFLFFNKVCSAQETTTEEQYQVFLKKYRLYQASSDSYNNAKSKYLSYQSVTSRADYLESSRKYLILEIEAAEAYTGFIRSRLIEATKILNYQENLYFIRLDDEITYLSVLKKNVNGAASVSEFLVLWQDFEKHFQSISTYGYAIKSYIEIGSLDKINENLKITKDKINQYLLESPADNSYVKAAKDNFSISEKDYSKITSSLVNLKNTQKNFSQGSGAKETAVSIRKEVNQTLAKIQSLITNYQKLLLTIVSR